MATSEDMIRKVQGLLAKAAGTDNEAEAAAFYAKAQELITKYAIDEQALREADPTRKASNPPVKIDFMYATNDSNAVGKARLLNVIARSCHVRMVNYPNQRYENVNRPGNSGIASQWCALVGFESDIELTKLLYASLLVQGTRFGHEDWKRVYGKATKGASKFLTGYLAGFAGRVSERFDEQAGKLAQNSMALIVLRDEEVNDALRKHFPSLTHKKHNFDGHGAYMGRIAGDRADIGNPRMSGGFRKLGTGR